METMKKAGIWRLRKAKRGASEWFEWRVKGGGSFDEARISDA